MPTTKIIIISTIVVLAFAGWVRWKRDWINVWMYPREILFLETAKERRAAISCGHMAFLKNWRNWAALIGYTIPLGLLGAAIDELTLRAARARALSFAEVLLGLCMSRVVVLFLIPLMYIRCRKWMRVFLRQYLNDRGVPICRSCGYDLRGQVDPRCSECGKETDCGDAS